jgi:hypothetical protein
MNRPPSLSERSQKATGPACVNFRSVPGITIQVAQKDPRFSVRFEQKARANVLRAIRTLVSSS